MSSKGPLTLLLPNVSCLDMSGTSSVQAETQEISSLNNIEAFAAMLLPNLEELDLSYSRMPRNVLYLKIASVCHKLRRMKGNACRGLIDMTDGFLGRISGSLTELHLDHNSQLYSYFLGKFGLQSFFSTAVAALNDWVSRMPVGIREIARRYHRRY